MNTKRFGDWRDNPPIRLPRKLESQTPEQEKSMFELRQRYLDWAQGPLPEKQASVGEIQSAVLDVLKLATVAPREIIVVKGPLQAQVLANTLRQVVNLGDNLRVNLRDSLGVNLRNSLRVNLGDSLRVNLGDSLWDSLGVNLGDSLGVNLRDSLGVNLRNSLRVNLGVNLGDSLGVNLEGNLRNSLGGTKLEFVPMDWFGITGQWWIAYYDHIANTLMPDRAPDDLKTSIATVRRLLEVGVAGALTFESAIIVWRRPTHATYDDRNRAHNATGPSVLWQDGYCQWSYHGVDLRGKSWMITEPERLNSKAVLDEPNVEVRRVMVEVMGKERFLAGADAKEMEAILDRSGSKCRLLQINIGGREPLQYTEVTCPSTGKVIYERVPGAVKTYAEARAWQFDYAEDATIKET